MQPERRHNTTESSLAIEICKQLIIVVFFLLVGSVFFAACTHEHSVTLYEVLLLVGLRAAFAGLFWLLDIED